MSTVNTCDLLAYIVNSDKLEDTHKDRDQYGITE